MYKETKKNLKELLSPIKSYEVEELYKISRDSLKLL